MKRAVLFDLDGILLDALEDLADAVNAALASLGFPDHPLDACRYYVGDGVEMLVRRALPSGVAAEGTLLKRAMDLQRAEYLARGRCGHASGWRPVGILHRERVEGERRGQADRPAAGSARAAGPAYGLSNTIASISTRHPGGVACTEVRAGYGSAKKVV